MSRKISKFAVSLCGVVGAARLRRIPGQQCGRTSKLERCELTVVVTSHILTHKTLSCGDTTRWGRGHDRPFLHSYTKVSTPCMGGGPLENRKCISSRTQPIQTLRLCMYPGPACPLRTYFVPEAELIMCRNGVNVCLSSEFTPLIGLCGFSRGVTYLILPDCLQ